ncbi:MAG TPA: hypothetical protein PKH65_01645 [Bacteroidia bacterium]|nr:hypothetical protein [Bacteroidia bacterium]HNT79358.1 hypothetical protein [Bacteroidia bacterium]
MKDIKFKKPSAKQMQAMKKNYMANKEILAEIKPFPVRLKFYSGTVLSGSFHKQGLYLYFIPNLDQEFNEELEGAEQPVEIRINNREHFLKQLVSIQYLPVV